MKRRFLALGLAAVAAVTGGSVYQARAQIGSDVLTTFIAWNLEKYALMFPEGAVRDGFMTGARQVWTNTMVGKTWSAIMELLGEGDPLLGLNGGGASGDMPQCAMSLSFDASGNLIIPAMPLTPGGALTRPGGPYWKHQFGTPYPEGYPHVLVSNPHAAALYWAHRRNPDRGSDKRTWFGVWRDPSPSYSTSGSTTYISRWDYSFRTVAHTSLTSGSLVPAASDGINATYYGGLLSSAYQDACPMDPAIGGDFDFYLRGSSELNMKACLHYAPNQAISASGYYYPEMTTVPAASIPQFPTQQSWLKDCELSVNVPLAMLNKLIEDACPPGWDCPAMVAEELDGDPPEVDEIPIPIPELPEDPNNPETGEPGEPEPEPYPTPTPTEGQEAPPVGLNEPAAMPYTAWLPSLPDISLSFPTTCPTYSMEAFEETYELTTHCIFIEENRGAIGAIMIAIFLFGGVLIILRS